MAEDEDLSKQESNAAAEPISPQLVIPQFVRFSPAYPSATCGREYSGVQCILVLQLSLYAAGTDI